MTTRGSRFWIALRKCVAVGLCHACPMELVRAQEASIQPIKSSAPVIVRPYVAVDVPPVRLANSARLRDLVRAGVLYLTLEDAIALALENDLDLEVSRYSLIAAPWQVQRAEAGGQLPSLPKASAAAASAANGQGAMGSLAAVGSAATGAVSTDAAISPANTITESLDPSFQEVTGFSHRTEPESDTVISNVPDLISTGRVYTGTFQQGFLTGGSVTATYSEHYLNENAPSDFVNPSVAPNLSVLMSHNLLKDFGVAVNARGITVAKINVTISDLNFKLQVISTVDQVLNTYFGLIAREADLNLRTSAVEFAQTLYDDAKKAVQIGALTPLDLIAAETQVATAARDLQISQASLDEQELQLKNMLSRSGVADPALAAVRVVPIDRLDIPDQDNLPPLQELIGKALANRSDLEVMRLSLKSAEVSALGSRNGILPSLQVSGGESDAGLAGAPRTAKSQGQVETPDPYFAGGLGTALGQVFRHDLPTGQASARITAPVRNGQAQADFGIDQLQLRQTDLATQKASNQIGSDVSNSVIGLRQARIRYETAIKSLNVAQRLLKAEQDGFRLGAATVADVVEQERILILAQASENLALLAYNAARVALDETLGTTLETNHISVAEASAGIVARPSSLPSELPRHP